jgi:hypothetical protein
MIRDPSDGTVREAITVGIKDGDTGSADRHGPVSPKPLPDTGLRQPTRTDAQERLEKSREWLKRYHARNDYPQKPEERHVSSFED